MKIPVQVEEMISKRILLLFCIWILTLAGGMTLMAWYANSPGDSGIPPGLLSAGLPVKQQENHFQLLMFVHPRCACTRSSLRELERLLAQCPVR